MIMKLAITGSTGFAGFHVIRYAQANNVSVYPMKADLLDRSSLAAELAEISPTHVLHLAAKTFVGDRDVSSIYQTNIVGTTNLLEAASDIKGLKKILLTSSANIYGRNSSESTSEATRPSPTNHYANSKLAMEHVATFYQSTLPIVVSRPFNFTGPRQSVKFVIPKLVAAYVEGRSHLSLGNLDVRREYNDVDLFSSATLQILKVVEPGEVLNICSGRTIALVDVIKYLDFYFNHQLIIKSDPSLKRNNEISVIGGDPTALKAAIEDADFKLPDIDFEKTIQRMESYLNVSRA